MKRFDSSNLEWSNAATDGTPIDRAGDAVMYTYNHRTLPCIRVSGIRVRIEERPLGAASPVYCTASMFASVRWEIIRLVIFDSSVCMALVADYNEDSMVVPRRHLILDVDDHAQLFDWSMGVHAGCLNPSLCYEDALIEFVADDNETILIPNVLRMGWN